MGRRFYRVACKEVLPKRTQDGSYSAILKVPIEKERIVKKFSRERGLIRIDRVLILCG